MDLIILAGLFFNLVFFKPERVDGDEIACLFTLFFIAAYSFGVPKKREVHMPEIGILILIAIFSTAHHYTVPTRVGVTQFVLGCMAFKVIAEHITVNAKRVGWVMLAWAVASNAFIVLQFMKIDPIYQPVYTEIAGTSLMPWVMGCLAAMAVPFVASVHPLAPLALLPMAILSHSTVCFVAYAGAFGAPYVKNFKTLGLILIAGLSYIAIYDPIFDHRRFVGILETMSYIKSGILGNGMGSFAHSGFLMYNGLTAYHWRWAHNEFYQYFFEQGLFAVLVLTGWVICLIADQRDKTIRTLLGVIVFLACFHPIFHFGKTVYLSLIILGLAEASKQSFKRENPHGRVR